MGTRRTTGHEPTMDDLLDEVPAWAEAGIDPRTEEHKLSGCCRAPLLTRMDTDDDVLVFECEMCGGVE